MGGKTGVARAASGDWVDYFVVSSTAALEFTPSNTARLSLTAISVKELTMPSPFYAKSGSGAVYLEALYY